MAVEAALSCRASRDAGEDARGPGEDYKCTGEFPASGNSSGNFEKKCTRAPERSAITEPYSMVALDSREFFRERSQESPSILPFHAERRNRRHLPPGGLPKVGLVARIHGETEPEARPCGECGIERAEILDGRARPDPAAHPRRPGRR